MSKKSHGDRAILRRPYEHRANSDHTVPVTPNRSICDWSISKIFNDTKRRAVSLWQLSILYCYNNAVQCSTASSRWNLRLSTQWSSGMHVRQLPLTLASYEFVCQLSLYLDHSVNVVRWSCDIWTTWNGDDVVLNQTSIAKPLQLPRGWRCQQKWTAVVLPPSVSRRRHPSSSTNYSMYMIVQLFIHHY